MGRCRLPRTILSFARDRRGVAATEFILIAPLLLLVLIGSFSIFDWLRAGYVTERATFTVGDLMSRQTERSDATLGRIKETFFHLAVNDVDDPELRIMSVLRTEKGFEIGWTYNSRMGTLASQPLPVELLPDIALDDSVILTQTIVRIVPTFSFLFDALDWSRGDNGYVLELQYAAATRPRFVRRIAQAQ